MIEVTLSAALSPAHKLPLQKCWSDYALTKEKLWTGEKPACGGLVISPSVLAIWPEDWSSRWRRCRPGCLNWLLVCPKTWSCWTRQELRPLAGMSGCAGCTHSFPQTVWTEENKKWIATVKMNKTPALVNLSICVAVNIFSQQEKLAPSPGLATPNRPCYNAAMLHDWC